mmetsp:Transcript_54736/g.118356  ORF Transcript_54736/g.118356 Transcript_54736/m.118356 type:complete len:202 (+) Transcript_54736:539-1144(+)
MSRLTFTRPPTKPVTTALNVGSSAPSSSSSLASTVSPMRKPERGAMAGSTATMCQLPRSASGLRRPQPGPSSKSDDRRAFLGADLASHLFRCASSQRLAPEPNSTKGSSGAPFALSPAPGPPARSSMSQSFLFEASRAAASPLFSGLNHMPRDLCWNLSFFSASLFRSHSGTLTRGHGFSRPWYEAGMLTNFRITEHRRSL